MTLMLAALMFTLSFDALRQLAVEIGVRPNFSWMAPVAIDVAQAAATLGLVALGTAEKYRAHRAYCVGLAVATVLLSVAGNGYHAYQLAARNAARVAAGENLGFTPQPAPIAAGIAMIFPLLWLGLLHMFTIMLRALQEERAHTMAAPARAHAPKTHPGDIQIPVTDSPAPEPVAVVHAPTPAPQRDDTPPELAAPQPGTIHTVESPVHHVDPVVPRTRNGWPQTHDGLTQFLAECTLPEPVKDVAAMLVREPHLKQVHVAQRINVDRSTVCRRWKSFVAAAEDEGFTVPPLPQPFDADPDLRPARELQPA